MLKYRAILSAIALAVVLTACAPEATVEPADVVLINARIYTLDPDQPWAEAMAASDGRIVFVGEDDGAEAYVGAGTRVIDGGGRFAMPGFIDSHNHIGSGAGANFLNLGAAETTADFNRIVKAFSDSHPDLDWLVGGRWNYKTFPGRLPNYRDLEGLTGGRPIMITSYDAHTTFLNKQAMELLGISAASESVPFGEIVRDGDGNPTGIFKGTLNVSREDREMLRRVLPRRDPEDRYRVLQQNLRQATEYGITTIVSPQIRPGSVANYRRARDDGSLTSHLHLALFHPPGTSIEEVAEFQEIRAAFENDPDIHAPAVKLYIDDVIETHVAAMLDDYEDRPGHRGETFFPPGEFADLVTRLDGQGFQLFIHAIGDRGIRVALDALEAARERNGARDSRHQLVHIEVMAPEDIPRFGALGVVATMQPRHVTIDGTRWRAAVGEARSAYAWPFVTLRETGAVLAFSSDWTVSEMDPLIGIQSAVTRQSLDGEPEGGWIPAQRVSVETAIRAYTIGGAYANFMEQERGSIEVGKFADLIVLSGSPLDVPAATIKDLKVLLTLFEGETVYRAAEFAGQ